MLHERTAPLVDHDAVAVRDQSDTLLLYAERLTTAQRSALRRYLLEALAAEEGPAATVAVSAGATEWVLAGAKGRIPVVSPLGTVGAALFTLVAGLVASAFVAAVVVLLVEAQLHDRREGRGSGSLMAAGGRPAPSPGGPEVVVQEVPAGVPAGSPPLQPQVPSVGGELLRLVPGLPIDVPGAVPDAVRLVGPPVPPITGPGGPAAPAGPAPAAPAGPLQGPPPAPNPSGGAEGQVPSAGPEPGAGPLDVDLPDVGLPDVGLPDIEVPDIGAPVDLPDVDLPDVDLPDVELPEVDLPDVDLPVPVPDLPDVPDIELPDVDVPDIEVPDGESSEESESGDDEASAGEGDDESDSEDGEESASR